MSAAITNQSIVEAMRRSLGPKLEQAAMPHACDSAFTVADFDVMYTSKELMAEVEVNRIPAGVTLLGVTVAASPTRKSKENYCMGVASQSKGLPIPVSVLGASTSPSFSNETTVVGIVILAYTRDGKTIEQCEMVREFKVGP